MNQPSAWGKKVIETALAYANYQWTAHATRQGGRFSCLARDFLIRSTTVLLIPVKRDNGKHISNYTVYNHLKSIVRKMGRPEVRVHDLRHTSATLSLQNGTDPKTVSDALGHASVSFTLDRYGHVSTEMRSDSANRMTSFIKDLQGSQVPVGV